MLKAVCSCGETEVVFQHLRELPNPWVRGCCIKKQAERAASTKSPTLEESFFSATLEEPTPVTEAVEFEISDASPVVSEKQAPKGHKKGGQNKIKGGEPQ